MRTRHSIQSHWRAFWRENLPACALFFAIYVFGACCGYASFSEPYRERIAAEAAVFLAALNYRPELLLSLLIALTAELFYIGGMMLSAFQYATVPLWGVLILLKAFFAGLCVRFCSALGAFPARTALWACCLIPLLLSIPAEVYLAVLPTQVLWRRRGRHQHAAMPDDLFLRRSVWAGSALLLLAAIKALLIPKLYLWMAAAG